VPNQQAIAPFWLQFRERQDELKAIRSAAEPVYDQLLEALQQVERRLYFEFSVNGDSCELIITADGKQEVFPAARAVVAAAPPLPGWNIHALKPKLGFPKLVSWEGASLDVARVMFDPLERKSTGELGLDLVLTGVDAAHATDAHNALLRAIDHGLGEERHATAIAFTQLKLLPQEADTSTFIVLTELERFLDWRDAKRRRTQS
jgi:hypothetical protein